AGAFDAVVGLAVGEPEDGGAVGEQGGEAGGEVEAAGVELGEARDEGDGRGTLGAGQAGQCGEQRLVVEWSEGRQRGGHGPYILRSRVRPGPESPPSRLRRAFHSCRSRAKA